MGRLCTAKMRLFLLSLLLLLLFLSTRTMKAEAQSMPSPPIMSLSAPTTVVNNPTAGMVPPTTPVSLAMPGAGAVPVNYTRALQLSTLFLDAQRSGYIPDDRVPWRGNSSLNDGLDVLLDLTGGFYDSGDTTKSTFPMAFGITMLSWGVIEYRNFFAKAFELQNALRAIKWGTDYLLKAWRPDSQELYVIVGDKFNDDKCWMRPERLHTVRPSYQVNATLPGSDVAGEVSAAFAAAAIAWNMYDTEYAAKLLNASVSAFVFANNKRGVYSTSVPILNTYVSFNQYGDELLWAAAWIHRATSHEFFKAYATQSAQFLGGFTDRGEFSWDDKYAGVQVLMARSYLLNQTIDPTGLMLSKYKGGAESFLCQYLDRSQNFTAGGLAYLRDSGPIQYAVSSSFLAIVYADYLTQAGPSSSITCGATGNVYGPAHLMQYAYSQADYILGRNPYSFSYMVGNGVNFPLRVHHRGASFPDYRTDPTEYTCELSDGVLKSPSPNPINLTGAIVGGPNRMDMFADIRTNINQTQVQFSTGAMWTALLARLTAPPPSATPPAVASAKSPSVSAAPPGLNLNCPDPAANGYPGVNYTVEVVHSFSKYGESVAQYRCIIWNNNKCPIRDLMINCDKFLATSYWMVRVVSKYVCMLSEDKPVLAIGERYEFGYEQSTSVKASFSTKSYIVET